MVFSQSCSYSRETSLILSLSAISSTPKDHKTRMSKMVWNALFFLLFSTPTQREFWRYKPVLLSLYDERKKKSLDYLLLHTELQEKSSLGTVFTSQQPQISNFMQLYMSGFPLKGNERRCGEWQESNLELRWTFTAWINHQTNAIMPP
jgi:hypothetical protein